MFNAFDSIYIEILVKSGIVKQDDYFIINPYKDENLKKAFDES